MADQSLWTPSSCPHHGSHGTHSVELMQEIRAKRFLISTDGSRHKHPHIESIARTVKHGGGDIEPGVQLREGPIPQMGCRAGSKNQTLAMRRPSRQSRRSGNDPNRAVVVRQGRPWSSRGRFVSCSESRMLEVATVGQFASKLAGLRLHCIANGNWQARRQMS